MADDPVHFMSRVHREASPRLFYARGAGELRRVPETRVLSTSRCGLVDIPALLRAFSQRHDRVAIRLKVAEYGTTGLVEMLRSGDLDLALIMQCTQLPDLAENWPRLACANQEGPGALF